MEEQSDTTKKIIPESQPDTIEVSLEFLNNIKHILEVITERTNFKYNEISQVGPVFTQLDKLLK